MKSYLSARQAAQYCGVSEKTIRNWLAAGRLSAERVGHSYRIPREQLEPLRRASAAAPKPPCRSTGEVAPVEGSNKGDGRQIGPAFSGSEVLILLQHAQAEAIAKAEE